MHKTCARHTTVTKILWIHLDLREVLLVLFHDLKRGLRGQHTDITHSCRSSVSLFKARLPPQSGCSWTSCHAVSDRSGKDLMAQIMCERHCVSVSIQLLYLLNLLSSLLFLRDGENPTSFTAPKGNI